MLSGWIVAGLCLYVVRVPDPANPQQSSLIVIPKNRLAVTDTYVDARSWTMTDVASHPLVVLRLLRGEGGRSEIPGRSEKQEGCRRPVAGRFIESACADHDDVFHFINASLGGHLAVTSGR